MQHPSPVLHIMLQLYISNEEKRGNFCMHREKDDVEISGKILSIMELENSELTLTDCWGWTLNEYCSLYINFSFSRKYVADRNCTLNKIFIPLYSATRSISVGIEAFWLFPWASSDNLTWQSADLFSGFSTLLLLSAANYAANTPIICSLLDPSTLLFWKPTWKL